MGPLSKALAKARRREIIRNAARNRRHAGVAAADLEGSNPCVGCLNPTDTAVEVLGESRLHIGFLEVLGLRRAEARACFSDLLGLFPYGSFARVYLLCEACASVGSFPTGLVYNGAVIPTLQAG